jgi:hypothetical protein
MSGKGTQFDKIIRGIVESKLYGYTLLEIMPHTSPRSGKLAEVNIIERRNVTMGYIEADLDFKYSNRIEMNNEDRIKLYGLITDKYEVTADEIEKEFGIHVGRQLNLMSGFSGEGPIMSDEEYYKRYGRARRSEG